jgi:hypothetical protein
MLKDKMDDFIKGTALLGLIVVFATPSLIMFYVLAHFISKYW